jgi:hypothetical protein
LTGQHRLTQLWSNILYHKARLRWDYRTSTTKRPQGRGQRRWIASADGWSEAGWLPTLPAITYAAAAFLQFMNSSWFHPFVHSDCRRRNPRPPSQLRRVAGPPFGSAVWRNGSSSNSYGSTAYTVTCPVSTATVGPRSSPLRHRTCTPSVMGPQCMYSLALQCGSVSPVCALGISTRM